MRILRLMNAVPASWYYRALTELQEMKDRESIRSYVEREPGGDDE